MKKQTPSFSFNLKSFDPSQLEELIGHTYLKDPDEDGNVLRVHMIQALDDYSDNIKKDPDYIKFIVQLDDLDKTEEIVTYNDIV